MVLSAEIRPFSYAMIEMMLDFYYVERYFKIALRK